MLSHALTIQPTITSKGADLWLPAALYSCFPASNQSWYDFVQLALKRLFQQTSGAWMKPMQPPGMTAWSTFNFLRESFVSLPTWHLKAVLHKQSMWSKHYRAEIVLRNSLIHPVRALECQYFFASKFFTNSVTGRFLGQRMCGLTWYHHPF